MPSPGYNTFDGTGLNDELLAGSTGIEMIPITIDTSARDTAGAITTNLPRGLILFPDPTVGGRYTQCDAATVTSSLVHTCVVLGEDIFDIDDGNQTAKAFYRASFKNGVLMDDSGTTLTHFDNELCQRIRIRDNA